LTPTLLGLIGRQRGRLNADLGGYSRLCRTVAPTSKLVNSLLTALVESPVRRRTIPLQARSSCAPADAAERPEQMSLAKQAMFGTADTRTSPIQILFEQARTFHANGNLAEAAARYKKVLKKRPNHFDAWHMLGLCELNGRDYEAAVRSLKRAVLLDSQSAVVHSDLGIALKAHRRYDEALACFDRAVALQPDFADACYNRANLLIELSRFTEAVAGYDRVLAITPQHLHAWKSRGNALHGLARFADAVASYDQALAIAPDDAGAWTNRGQMLRLLGRLDDALASTNKALSIHPDIPEAWLVRATVLIMKGNVTDAQAGSQRALALKPDYAKALTLLGQCHLQQGNVEAAVSCFDRALAIMPDDETTLSSRIFALDFSGDGDFAVHQAARSEWWRRIRPTLPPLAPVRHDNDRDPNRRLVLGYVSAEFRDRSAAFSFRPVLENHDRTQFEIICYSGTPSEDAVTASFRELADHWRDALQWSDDQLVECIRADKVDILIDLSGHTDGNRLRAFARKPAPVQVTAWGHPTGTGLPAIDYLLSDPVLLPAAVRHLLVEQVCDLPCAIIIEPPKAELRGTEPPVIANGHVTYGVFSRVSRFSDAAIALWARILRSDVTARLLIKDHLINDVTIQRRLLQNFASHGIAADRISLLGSTSREDHLAAYRQVDICLDPVPHGGGVSVWEPLHMGVPIVTRLGNGIASRAGGAILSAIGLSDWIATDDDRYVAIALRSTPDRLRAIRHDLPGLIDRCCSPGAYTRAVEAAYRGMWQTYRGGDG
jgi:predicted O-linked N-acetylglucosamine transferase (SPINDLY family)